MVPVAKLSTEDHESTVRGYDGYVVLAQYLLYHDIPEAALQHPSAPAEHRVLHTCIILNMYHFTLHKLTSDNL